VKVCTMGVLESGCAAKVLSNFDFKRGSGYLSVKSGEFVRILYVGQKDDDLGWIFAERLDCSEGNAQGWLLGDAVRAMPQRVASRSAASKGDGYLSVSRGELLAVLYDGSAAQNDAEWLFVLTPANQRGWLHRDVVSEIKCPTKSRVFLFSEIGEVLLRAHPDCIHKEFPRPKLPHGLEVEFIKSSGEWRQIACRFLNEPYSGWIPAGNLKPHLDEIDMEPDAEPCPTTQEAPSGCAQALSVPEGVAKSQVALRGFCRGDTGFLVSEQGVVVLRPNSGLAQTESVPLPIGLQVEVLDVAMQDGGWIKVRGDDQRVEGWVSAACLAREAPCPPTGPPPRGVEVRSPCVVSPVSQQRTVVLLTFGLETLDNELHRRCQNGGGGASINMPDDELRAALARRDFPHVDQVIDARDFHDPTRGALTRHIGKHPKIIAGICQNRNFDRWLRHTKRCFKRIWNQPKAPNLEKMTIAVFCRAGRHRSVAVSIILFHILTNEGYTCEFPKHLSSYHWRRCCGGNCDECTAPGEELDVVLNAALKSWRSCP